MKTPKPIILALLGMAVLTGCAEKKEPVTASPAAAVSQPAANTVSAPSTAPSVGGGAMVTTGATQPAAGLPPTVSSAPTVTGAPPAMSAPVVTQNAPQSVAAQGNPGIPGSYNTMPPAPRTGVRSMEEQHKDKSGL